MLEEGGDLCDAAPINAAHWQAVEGSGHQTAPAPNDEGVHCDGATRPCVQSPLGGATQQEAALQQRRWHRQQTLLHPSAHTLSVHAQMEMRPQLPGLPYHHSLS